jgi:hypothetical protein
MAAISRLTGTESAARSFLDDGRAALDEARGRSAAHAAVPYFCAIWKNPWMTANDETYLADLLRVAGGRNVFGSDSTRYPRTTLGEIIVRRPVKVLLPTEPYAFSETDRKAFAEELPEAEICLVDGMLLAWHGIRTAAALRAFSRFFAGERQAAAPNEA